METLVVADSKMTEFYKNDNVETYILTIMNMVLEYDLAVIENVSL